MKQFLRNLNEESVAQQQQQQQQQQQLAFFSKQFFSINYAHVLSSLSVSFSSNLM